MDLDYNFRQNIISFLREFHAKIANIESPLCRALCRTGEILGIIFLFPFLTFLLLAQVAFDISVWLLDAIVPPIQSTTAFSAGTGGLRSGIGLTFTLLFFVLRHIVDLILRFKVLFNFAWLAMATWYFLIYIFNNVDLFLINPHKYIANYIDSWTPKDTKGFEDYLILLSVLVVAGWIGGWIFKRWDKLNGYHDDD